MIDYSAAEDARQPGTLAGKLETLRTMSAQASHEPRLLEWAVETLGIEQERAPDWCARAWWGVAAGELMGAYLFDEALIDEAFDLLVPPDWSSIDDTLKSAGAIIVGSHLGPPSYLMNVIIRRFKDAFILNNTDDMPHWLPGHCAKIHNPMVAADRSLIMLSAAAHIRKGGLFFGTADIGHSDTNIIFEDVYGKKRISLGIAALARLLRVRMFPVEALWEGNRIVLKHAVLPQPAPDLDNKVWYAEWAAGYWKNIQTIRAQSPENNRRLKRLFRRERFFA